DRFIGISALFITLKWNTVLSLRGELGYMMRNGRDIPIDEKFYLGGINTLRGYGSRTVSPVKVNTVNTISVLGIPTPVTSFVYLGGIKEAVFNIDYVFPIIKDAGLKGVVFFDAGNSYAPGEQVFSKMLYSYGAGIRWYSPMGPLRLEYGIPVNPREGIDSKSGKFEFSIGGFF
ncbi:outer membrane protein assembly factor BamA, partial [bacterium]|nr:outer membrane protein assembly factor BamA [bacterium]